jgi:hypothetical protein
MINTSLSPMIALLVTMAFSGFAFGVFYFVALERSITLFASNRGWLGPLAYTLGRMAAAVFFLGLAAKLGALYLLATFLGFLLARAVSLRVARRTG